MAPILTSNSIRTSAENGADPFSQEPYGLPVAVIQQKPSPA